MKTYKGKEVEVLVEPHGQSMSYYAIKYREKRRFNWFNPWITYCYTWSIGLEGSDSFDPYQPHLFSKYDDALEEAKKLKSNPELIDENNEKRWKRYNELCDELKKYKEDRNKSAKL
jgi:hypothetical protein